MHTDNMKQVEKVKVLTTKHLECVWEWIKRHYTLILTVLIFIFIWLNFEDKWLAIFDNNLLSYINVSNHVFATIITLFLLLAAFIKVGFAIKNKYICSTAHCLWLSVIVSIYCYYRFSARYIYTPILWGVAYLDIYALILTFPIATTIINGIRLLCDKHTRSKNNKSDFIFDYPIQDKSEDRLNYYKEAESLAEKIINCKNDKSLSIGIISAWGVGKTSFLNLTKQAIRDKAILVDFNPRNSKTAQDIQADFFTTLSGALKKYNSNLSIMIREYMEALQVLDSRNIISSILSLTKSIDKTTTKDNLSRVLANLPKKVVVAIDDFDRLLKDEVLEIFKLIDGNASFPNIVFITAYDKAYVAKLVEDSYQNNDSHFSDKFFNLEVSVPLRSYQELFSYLRYGLLYGIEANKEDEDLYSDILSNHFRILEKYLPTMRDIKRFLNLFIKDYKPLIGEVDFEDFFLLTIIKYRNPDEHLNLFHRKRLKLSASYERYQYDNKEEYEFSDILKIIFPETWALFIQPMRPNYIHINQTKAFDNYFVNGIYGSLKQSEMNIVLGTAMENAIPKIEQWREDKLLGNFSEFLLAKDMERLGSATDFWNYVDKVLYVAYYYPEGQLYWNILTLMRQKSLDNFSKLYNIEKEVYQAQIINKLINNQPNYNYYILRKLLLDWFDNQFDDFPIILTKEELLKINNNNLSKHIERVGDIDEITLALLYSCIASVEPISRKIILDETSCKLVRDKIIEHPQFYISHFVGLGRYSSDTQRNAITCEAFWKQIFGSAEEFESFINDTGKDSIDKITRVRRFWELYKNNNYQQINFEDQGDVSEMIDTDLEEPYSHYQDIVKLKSQFEATKDMELSSKDRIEQYQSVKEGIQKHKLNIVLVDNLIDEIQQSINEIKANL